MTKRNGFFATCRGVAEVMLCHGVVLAMLATVSSGAEPQAIHGVRVRDVTVGPEGWSNGTILFRAEIENQTAQPQQVTVGFSNDYNDTFTGFVNASTMMVAPNSRSMVTIPRAFLPLGLGKAWVQTGRNKPERLTSGTSFDTNNRYHYSTQKSINLLVSQQYSEGRIRDYLRGDFLETEFGTKRSKSGSTPHTGLTPLISEDLIEKLGMTRLEVEPAGWPADWLAYSSFTACLVTQEEFRQMPDSVRQALCRYVLAGGTLVVAGEEAFEPGWPMSDSAWQSLDDATGLHVKAVGAGLLVRIPKTAVWEMEPADVAWLLVVLSDEGSERMRTAPTQALSKILRREAKMNHRLLETEKVLANIDFSFPVNRMLFLLGVFSVLAGPVAVMVLSRKNRRIWLLWVVPAFALAFSSIVFAVALLTEGVTPYTGSFAMTMLDQRQHMASTKGIVGVYMPVIRGDGLHFGRETDIDFCDFDGVGNRTIRLLNGQDQHYTGLIAPRLPSYFGVRHSETRTERLVVTPLDEGSIEVVNALGADIEGLTLCDAAGWVYTTVRIPAGEKARLTSREKPGAPKGNMLDRARAAFRGGYPDFASLDVAMRGSGGVLQPGEYVALLDGAPFIENPVKTRPVKARGQSLVFGVF